MRHSSIHRLKLVRTLLRQHRVDGHPVFREEAIGRPARVDIFIDSPVRVEYILRGWNTDLWSYRVVGINPAGWTEVPKGEKVYRGPSETFIYH